MEFTFDNIMFSATGMFMSVIFILFRMKPKKFYEVEKIVFWFLLIIAWTVFVYSMSALMYYSSLITEFSSEDLDRMEELTKDYYPTFGYFIFCVLSVYFEIFILSYLANVYSNDD